MSHAPQPGDRAISLEQPAAGFPEAFLLGNGSLGATVYGHPGVETFDLNLDTVWSGGPGRAPLAEARPGTLDELRAAVAAGDHGSADKLARELQAPGWTESYQPLGRLSWRWGPDDEPGAYGRRLDLASATARVETGSGSLETYVSAPDGVLVAEAHGAQASPRTAIEPVLGFESPHPVEVAVSTEDGVQWLVAVGRAPSRAVPSYVPDDDAVAYDEAAPDADGLVDAGMGWAVVAAVTGAAGHPGDRGVRARPARRGRRGFARREPVDVPRASVPRRRRAGPRAGRRPRRRARHRDRRVHDRPGARGPGARPVRPARRAPRRRRRRAGRPLPRGPRPPPAPHGRRRRPPPRVGAATAAQQARPSAPLAPVRRVPRHPHHGDGHDGAVSLLPTLPPSWRSGSVQGLRARGDRTVDLAWESGVLRNARIRTAADGELVVELAAGPRPAVVDDTGVAIEPQPTGPAPRGCARWVWPSAAGRTYAIEQR